ncbi:MAG: radical SAM protein [Polynucleobacter sp.]|nr:radical SAM protein [Polynucleobacter sp.]
MKAIQDNVVIQIEVTNACHLSCANCSRFVGHHKKPFYMTLDQVREAILSLEGFGGRIGLMGGEPALHPQFKEICEIYQELIPNKRKREFWTAGYKWDEYRDVIKATFDEDLVHYNDHSRPDEGWHQPLLVAIDEVLEDKKVMWKLIDNCWVQQRWSASITPKGAFFCEVAAALDHVLDGPGGWKIEKDWWRKTDKDYIDQKKRCCTRCSAALPMAEIPNNHLPVDMVSAGNLKLLEAVKSPKVKSQRINLVKREDAIRYLNSVDEVVIGERGYLKSHPDWRPSEFRTKIWHGPGEGELSANAVRKMQMKGQDLDKITNLNKGVENQIKAQHRGPYVINDSVLLRIRSLVGDKAVMLEEIQGMAFETSLELFRSVDSWTGSAFSEGELQIVANESASQ